MFRVALLLIVIACIVLAVTNPRQDTHKTLVYQRLSNQAGVTGLLGEVTGGVMENLDLVPLKYHNYVLFSTMTFREDTVSVGLLTKAWTTDWSGVEQRLRASIP
jgi:hypothetical protein